MRQVEKLAPYGVEIHHVRGKSNKVADGLSRRTTQIYSDRKYPQNLLRDFKNKGFHVHDVATITGAEKYKKSLINGYQRDHDFIRIYKNPKRQVQCEGQITVF